MNNTTGEQRKTQTKLKLQKNQKQDSNHNKIIRISKTRSAKHIAKHSET